MPYHAGRAPGSCRPLLRARWRTRWRNPYRGHISLGGRLDMSGIGCQCLRLGQRLDLGIRGQGVVSSAARQDSQSTGRARYGPYGCKRSRTIACAVRKPLTSRATGDARRLSPRFRRRAPHRPRKPLAFRGGRGRSAVERRSCWFDLSRWPLSCFGAPRSSPQRWVCGTFHHCCSSPFGTRDAQPC